MTILDNYKWFNNTIQCGAIQRIKDDRWGEFAMRCGLVAGHDVPHARKVKGCKPVGVMIWEDQ